MTGNPGGISDYDFKIRYIQPDYSLWTESELRRKDKMIFISSNVYDNEHLGEEYVETLMSISMKLLGVTYISLADGSIGNQRVTAYQFVVVGL